MLLHVKVDVPLPRMLLIANIGDRCVQLDYDTGIVLKDIATVTGRSASMPQFIPFLFHVVLHSVCVENA